MRGVWGGCVEVSRFDPTTGRPFGIGRGDGNIICAFNNNSPVSNDQSQPFSQRQTKSFSPKDNQKHRMSTICRGKHFFLSNYLKFYVKHFLRLYLNV